MKTNQFFNPTLLKTLMTLTLVSSGITNCYGYVFSGKVVDREMNGIADAKITVTKVGENKPIVIYSDNDGKYSLDLEQGKYKFTVTSPGYRNFSISHYISSDSPPTFFTLYPEATVLPDVEIVSDQLESVSNKDIMYLSAENRKHGLNALDAISSLPRFISTLNGSSLQNMSGETVTILIEGRKASSVQLTNLTGNDIAKVEYYPTSPAKFAGYAGGPIVDVFLKRPKELKLNGNIKSSNCVIYTSEFSNAGLTFMNPNNLVMGSFNNYCLNTSDIGASSLYDYGNSSNSLVSRSGFNHMLSNNAALNYQWDNTNNMFYASFNYQGGRNKAGFDYDLNEIRTDKTLKGDASYENYEHSDGFSLDLYYTHKFSRGQELSIDVVNSLNKSADTADNSRTVGEESDYTSFEANTFSRNRVYTLIVNAMFSSPLGGGEINASLFYSYKHLNQDFINNFYPQNTSHNFSFNNSSYASVGYFRNFNKVSADLTVNAFYEFRRQPDGGHFTDFQCLPRLNVRWNISNTISARYSFWVQSSQKSIGVDNENMTFVDTRLFKQNSMSMHAVYKYCNNLSFDISIPTAKLFFTPLIGYYHRSHPYVETATREGDIFVIRNTEVPFTNEVAFSINARYNPAPWLYVIGIYNCDYAAYNLPGQKMRKTANSFQLRAGGRAGHFQYEAGITTPKHRYDGYTRWHEDWNFSASAFWIPGSWYVGLSYSFYGLDTWTGTDYGHLCEYSKSDNPYLQKMITVTVGYNFEAGKLTKRNNASKRLNNTADDFGI